MEVSRGRFDDVTSPYPHPLPHPHQRPDTKEHSKNIAIIPPISEQYVGGDHVIHSAEGKKSYQVFEDQREAAVGVDDVVQSHNVGVFQVFQQRNYSDTKTRRM